MNRTDVPHQPSNQPAIQPARDPGRRHAPSARRRLRTATALVIAGGLTVAACGGDDDSGDAAPSTADVATTVAAGDTAADTAADAAGEFVITIDEFAFGGVTSVPAGTTVTVVNNDSVAHTWTSADGAFDSDSIAPGSSFQFTFDEAGSYAFFCAFHAQMGGTLTVTA